MKSVQIRNSMLIAFDELEGDKEITMEFVIDYSIIDDNLY